MPVAGNGAGVPPEDVERILEICTHSDRTPTVFGLVRIGLSICRTLARVMGGASGIDRRVN